ncbi:cytochrome c oxidase subunit 3, partial [Acinetobacter baumannii]
RPEMKHLHGANPNAAQLFMSLYFVMTGLHAIHIIVGILIIGALMAFWFRKNKLVTEDYIPTELVGLYWHFVDLVWIFLFPLYYLIPR